MSIRLDRNAIGFLLAGAGVDAWGVADNHPDRRLPLAPDLPTALVILRRLPADALEGLHEGPTPAYRQAYRQLNADLDEAATLLADTLTAHGYKAERMPATVAHGTADVQHFSHKSAATRAGLGWIGKTALFISHEFGAGVRLATVFTSLPLPAGRPVEAGLCGKCRACIDACPAGAGRDVQWSAGMPRDELFDAFACEAYMTRLGEGKHAVCGICVGACPRTQAALGRTSRSGRG